MFSSKMHKSCLIHSILLSNFGAQAERSYIYLRFEAEDVLKMFLVLHGIKVMKTG